MHKIRKKKLQLWYKNPRCEKCGKLTILPEHHPKVLYKDDGQMYFKGDMPHDLATIQHKYHKQHPMRHKQVFNNERRHFLWCYKCNKEYNQQIEQPNLINKGGNENKL